MWDPSRRGALLSSLNMNVFERAQGGSCVSGVTVNAIGCEDAASTVFWIQSLLEWKINENTNMLRGWTAVPCLYATMCRHTMMLRHVQARCLWVVDTFVFARRIDNDCPFIARIDIICIWWIVSGILKLYPKQTACTRMTKKVGMCTAIWSCYPEREWFTLSGECSDIAKTSGMRS